MNRKYFIYFQSLLILSLINLIAFTIIYTQINVKTRAKYVQIHNLTQYLNKYFLEEYNQYPFMYSKDELEDYVQDDTIIIVIPISSQTTDFLRQQIRNLSKIETISNSLLIFSSAYYNSAIADVVRNITFVKVMIIYFPYSPQIYPDKFPGNDNNECPPNISFDEAIKAACNKGLQTDRNGEYRNADKSQSKLHWWWTVNQVFNYMTLIESHRNLKVFLEATDYVDEDLIGALIILINSRGLRNLSGADDGWSKLLQVSSLKLGKVVSEFRIAFNRTTWHRLQACVDAFCLTDDYTWQNSLLVVSESCHQIGMIVNEDCAGGQTRILGGFADPRDRNLCTAIATGPENHILL